MANVKISELPVATFAAVTDKLVIVQGGTTKQLSNQLLFTTPTITGKLDVVGTNGTATINGAGDQFSFGYNGFNYITASGANATLQIQASGATGKLTFGTAASERMRIDSAGNILIGTTTSPLVSRVYVNSTEARIQSRNTTSGANGYIGALSTNEWRGAWSTTNTPVTFGTNDTERMRIAGDGTVTFSGAALPNPGLALTFAIAAAL